MLHTVKSKLHTMARHMAGRLPAVQLTRAPFLLLLHVEWARLLVQLELGGR